MTNGPNMDTYGQRQARRFMERKGYARESMHLYRPRPEMVGKYVTKVSPRTGIPETKRVTEPFSTFKKNMAFWYLNLKADARRRKSRQFASTHFVWRKDQPTVRFCCYYERRAAGLT